jgi:hypothetical protein
MRLPARLEPEHVARNLSLAQIAGNGQSFAGVCRTHQTVPEAQTPLRRFNAAAGKEIVAADRIEHGGARKQVYVNAAGERHFHCDPAGLIGREVAHRIGSRHAGRCWRVRPCGRLDPRISAIEAGVPARIHQHAVSLRTDVERHRGMGIASIDLGIRVHPDGFLLAALRKREELQSEAEDLFLRSERQSQQASARVNLSCEGIDGRLRHRGKPLNSVRIRPKFSAGDVGVFLGSADGRLPDSWQHRRKLRSFASGRALGILGIQLD